VRQALPGAKWTLGVPPPGSTMGMSDAVQIVIEAEFLGPWLASAEPGK
jgi:hypothetical protein